MTIINQGKEFSDIWTLFFLNDEKDCLGKILIFMIPVPEIKMFCIITSVCTENVLLWLLTYKVNFSHLNGLHHGYKNYTI